jgi:hypothetical protein
MDPVKHKLNLLKKLANEKKNITISNSHEESTVISDVNSLDHSSESTINQKVFQNKMSLVNAEEEEFNVSDQEKKACIEKELNNGLKFENLKIENENDDAITSDINQNINDKIDSLFENNIEETQSINNSNNSKNEENEKSNIEVLDNINLKQENYPGKNIINSIYSNSKINQPDFASSKYVNRIRDYYDKERASSVESIHLQKKNNTQNSRQSLVFNQSKILNEIDMKSQNNIGNLKSKEIITNKNEDNVDENLSELNESLRIRTNLYNNIENNNSQNSELDESISCISNSSNKNKKANFTFKNSTSEKIDNKYIKHLRDSFNLLVNDSLYFQSNRKKDKLSKNYTSSFNLSSSNSNQIEKLREKFTKKYTDTQPINSFQKRTNSFRNSELEENTSDTQILNSSKILSLKSNSLNDDDYKSYIEQFSHIDKEVAYLESKKQENPTKNLHKYQKSKTLDLTDSILNQKEKKAFQSDKKLIEDYNNLREEINLDSKYLPENAIIKSTLSFDKRNIKSLKNENLTVPFENMFENNKARTFKSSSINNPPSIKLNKSILKSPSTATEKSIHFDDFINVIQIESPNDTCNSQFESESLNKDSYLKEQLEGLSKVHSNYLSVPSTTNEISLIKKFLIESSKKPNDFRIRNSPQKIKSNAERIFVKSPTPMREIFLNDDKNRHEEKLYDDENSFEHRENKNPRSRNRFSKKKPSIRSKSVESSQVNDYDSYSLDLANRPNLTRQNALGNTLTKSLVDNIDSFIRIKSEMNDNKSRRNCRGYPKSRKSKNANQIVGHRFSEHRSSSLTDSSSESLSGSISTSSSSSIDSIILKEKILKENTQQDKNYSKSILKQIK